MCTSVPQIEAILTRISTSSAVGSGTGTCRTSVLFDAGLSFTAAFIVATMDTPQCGRYGADAAEVFQSCVIFISGFVNPSCLYRMELTRSIPDDYEQVLLLRELPV